MILRRRERLAVNVDLATRIAAVGCPDGIELAVGGGFVEERGLPGNAAVLADFRQARLLPAAFEDLGAGAQRQVQISASFHKPLAARRRDYVGRAQPLRASLS